MKSGKIIIHAVCLMLATLLLFSCGSGVINESTDDGTGSKGSDVSTIDDFSGKNGFSLTGDTYISDGLAKNLPESLQKVSVTAAGTDGKIIATDDSFIIETSGDIEAEELTQYVSLSPTVNYTVTKLASCRFQLTPASSLLSGKVYRLLVGDKDNPAYSFAFQTETQLVIKSVLPADEAVNVPTNAGIEIEFTDSVYGNDFTKYISVSPAVDGYFTLYPDGKTVAFVPNHGLEENTVYKVSVSKGMTAVSGKILEEDKVFAFRTKSSKTNSIEDAYFYIYQTELLFCTDNYPVISYSSSSDISYTITADIYKYSSAYDAIQAKKAYEAVK
ncbi:MAG: Ig-like domain-containing protein, partial [Victivallales bacterium]